ncbi:MAG: hypothetical protein EXR83_04655 [Gammaproteobacteria bacterium]|nr:hypothetical protein [Gammaproteobacteria bacterium]
MSPPIFPPAVVPGANAHSLRGAFAQLGHWLFGKDGLTFADVLDVVNPLQHIPLVSTLYRRLTGDAIDPAMQLAGGALYGGPVGVALSALGLLFDATLAPASAAGPPATQGLPQVAAAPAAGRGALPVAWGASAIRPTTRAAAARAPPLAPGPALTQALTQAQRDGWRLIAAYAKEDAHARTAPAYRAIRDTA